jgi:hypothetical protein
MQGNEAMWVNLKILGQLQPFQRINTRAALFKCDEARHYIRLPEFIDRWFTGATRESDFNRIRDLYIVAGTEKNNNCKLKKHLEDSTKGLISLQKTYENDITMKARIDTLLEEVNTMIKNINK